MQRIGIDCRLSGIRHAGIGRYTQNLVKRLPQQGENFKWVLFFSDTSQVKEVLGAEQIPPNIQIVITPIRHYSLAEQLRLPGIFEQYKLDLLHVPHFNVPVFYQGKLVITIHDLLWHEYRGLGMTTLPPWFYHLKYIGYQFVVSQAIRKANHILVPAETIRQTLVHFYPDSSGKVTVTKEGIDDQLQLVQASTTKVLSSSPKILFYIGSLYPHKNIQLVIDALLDLPEYHLWLVGTRNVFQDRVRTYVQQKGLEERVKFLGYVSDKELHQVFKKVTALVQPSFSEGFGLTGLEAMAQQVPVLASRIPIFQEIYQDGAFYFDPHSVSSFVEAAHQLATLSPKEQQKVIKTAEHVARQYDWQKMVKETLKVYSQVLNIG